MGKKLAIKSHPTRGKEVIELLEMMGGRDVGVLKGNNDYYVIDECENNLIKFYGHNYIRCHEFVVLTLEEFLEKYPFKVGDKVERKIDWVSCVITNMRWNCDRMCVEYYLCSLYGNDPYGWHIAECLNKIEEHEVNSMNTKLDYPGRNREDVLFDSIIWHLRNSVNNGKQNLSGGECEEYFREVVKKNNENKMKNVLSELIEHIKTTSKENLEKEFDEIKEWSNVGPTVEEFMDFCDKVNKKPKYPKTYKECCDVLGIGTMDSDAEGYKADLIIRFQELLIAVDAYWKIAGEEMGLGKPWEPDWDNLSTNHEFIKINKGCFTYSSILLVFPTVEMRDTFYENFKDLIENCKELL